MLKSDQLFWIKYSSASEFVTLTVPYRNFSSGAYRFNGSPFTVPYRFLFFSGKRELNR